MGARYEITSGLHVALIEPEIPPNTGNIARLCGATFTPLHLVGKLGFRTDEKAVRRAGLDYWDEVEIHYHREIAALYQSLPDSRFLYFSTKAERVYTDWLYQPNDCLVFGRETRGLPEELLRANWERCLKIPMPNPRIRSLNLATSVGIALYEALRQRRPLHLNANALQAELVAVLSGFLKPFFRKMRNPAGGLADRSAIQDVSASLKPTILYKVKASYTEDAPRNRIEGEVVLNVVFAADGAIHSIRVVRGLPDGLTEKAIEAAKKTRFRPAIENGVPVSVRGDLSFTFLLY